LLTDSRLAYLKDVAVDTKPPRLDADDADWFDACSAVHRYLRKRTGCKHAADDLHQQTILQVLEKPDNFDGNRGPLVNWMISIARHIYFKWVEREQRLTDELSLLWEQKSSALFWGDVDELDRRDSLFTVRPIDVQCVKEVLDLQSPRFELLRRRHLVRNSIATMAQDEGIGKQPLSQRLHRERNQFEKELRRANACRFTRDNRRELERLVARELEHLHHGAIVVSFAGLENVPRLETSPVVVAKTDVLSMIDRIERPLWNRKHSGFVRRKLDQPMEAIDPLIVFRRMGLFFETHTLSLRQYFNDDVVDNRD
jgi:RNA polymerase sigma factor (sigma-70 family)